MLPYTRWISNVGLDIGRFACITGGSRKSKCRTPIKSGYWSGLLRAVSQWSHTIRPPSITQLIRLLSFVVCAFFPRMGIHRSYRPSLELYQDSPSMVDTSEHYENDATRMNHSATEQRRLCTNRFVFAVFWFINRCLRFPILCNRSMMTDLCGFYERTSKIRTTTAKFTVILKADETCVITASQRAKTQNSNHFCLKYVTCQDQ